MPEKTQKQLIAEINERTYKMDVALFGIPDTEDMGLYGIVKDVCKEVRTIDVRSRRNSVWINTFKWTVGLLVTGVVVGITKLVNWW